MKKLKIASLTMSVALACVPFVTACSGTQSPVEGKTIAYIMQMAKSDIFELWSASAKQTAEKLGMTYTEHFCDGNDEAWKQTVRSCARDGYDGLLLSHGGSSYSYEFLKEIKEEYPDLEIVTFDTEFLDNTNEVKTIEGVTQFFQQDENLAELSLDYIYNTLFAEKNTVNVLKVWKDDYISAFERREVGYAKYETQGKIHTVATVAPTDLSDAENSVKTQVLSILNSPQADEIDAIWCCYDLYARGAYSALVEAGSDIPLVSVDICNADIEKMQETNSPWKACATTNWAQNGEFGVRVLALQMADEYDKIINPVTGKASAWLEIPACLVRQDVVSSGNIDVNNLHTVAGEAYSNRAYLPTSEWLKALLD